MKNFKYSGQVFTYVAVAAVASGDLIIKGELVGVATKDAAIGEEVECQRTGVVELPKQAALAVVQGEKAYWDGSELDNAAGDDAQNDEVGVFYKDAAGSESVALIILKGGAAAFN